MEARGTSRYTMLASQTLAVATGVEPVPPDRQSGILPLDSATTFNFGCEGTIRTCMNRVRAGYPIQLNDLATLRRERSDTVFFCEREVTVAFTTPRISVQNKSGCRGANRTLMTSFKDSRPTIERPGISPPKLTCGHTCPVGSSGENRTPISALKGPHPGR